MAVGRISGPLLQNNLTRNGIDLTFADTNPNSPLLKLDVTNNKVMVAGTTSTADLHIHGTLNGVVLGITSSFDTGDLDFSGNTISALTGPINLNAPEAIVLSGLATDNITIDDNTIFAPNTNSNIDLLPNGTGNVEVFNGLEVFGNLHSNSNITANGNITIGNDDNDNLVLNAEITNDLIPDQNNTFDIGSDNKKWDSINVETIEATNVFAQGVTVGTTSFHVPQGNIFYVAKGGNDSAIGDNMYDPLLTVKQALARADGSTQGPVTIYIYPGEYEEIFPLEIPTNVTVAGLDMRNTIIKPTSATNTNNCFLLNGETTVQNITIKDFYSPGHAFSFASNTTVTTRSPYIKNVTVITKGSVVSASDPRGFDQGDAGKGALVDGASVTSASQEASMLFHSVTFITPGVDALTMTNGVRVEWLNSFTYFANRGLYATNGSTGHLSSDGSTTIFGAELRAIGSANVYGNFGAVGDGSGVLMYLIQHNMAYIGTGKNVTNDSSLVIQSQEINKTNSANIYFQTVDHRGNFRVGDQFLVNQDTGETTITITEGQVDSLNGLNVTTNNSTTIINGEEIIVGELLLKGNTISSTSGRIDLDSASGQINLLDNTNVTGNVSMTGNFTIGGSAIGFGNEPGDTINFNTPFSQNLVPDVSGLFSLGSSTNTWSTAFLSEIQADDIQIKDNFITTTESNSDLELRGNGSSNIIFDGTYLTINNDLQVDGITNLSTTKNLNSITGDLTLVGTNLQIGDKTVTGSVTATQNLRAGGDLVLVGLIPDPSFAYPKTYTLTANGITYTYNADSETNRNHYTGIASLNVPGLTYGVAPAGPGGGPVPVQITYESQGPGDQLILANTNGWTHVGLTAGTYPAPGQGNADLKDILIEENFITTKAGNQNLDIRAHNASITATLGTQFSVNSQEANPRGITFNNDGTKMFIVGTTGDDVNEYTVSTGFDLTSTVTFVDSFAVTQCPNPTAVKFNTNGTKMFVTGVGNSNVHEYALTTGFDVSTSSFTQTLVTSGKDDDNFGLDFNNDGTKMYITGNQNDKIYEYNLSSAFDISTATFNQELYVGNIDIEPFGIEWSPDGHRLFIVGTRGNGVDEFRCQTAFDISTATHIGFLHTGGNPSGIHISPDGTKMFIVGNSTDVIKQYALSVPYSVAAAGSGLVIVEDNADIANNLQSANITTNNVSINQTITSEEYSTGDIFIENNYITTTNSNSNLELKGQGTGHVYFENIGVIDETITTRHGDSTLPDLILTTDANFTVSSTGSIQLPKGTTAERISTAGNIRFNTDSNSFEGYATDNLFFGGIFSADGQTSVTADETANNILFTVNGAIGALDSTKIVGEINGDGLNIHRLDVDDIYFDSSTIRTSVSNSDLELAPYAGHTISGDRYYQWTSTEVNQASAGADTGFYLQYDTSPGPYIYTSSFDSSQTWGINFSELESGTKFGMPGRVVFNANDYVKIENDDIVIVFQYTGTAAFGGTGRTFYRPFTLVYSSLDTYDMAGKTFTITRASSYTSPRRVVIGDIKIKANTILNDSNGKASFAGTSGISGTGGPTGLGSWYKFTGGTGIVVPNGTDSNRGSLGQTAEIRWNTQQSILEVYDGSQWISAAGDTAGVDEAFMTQEAQLFALVLG